MIEFDDRGLRIIGTNFRGIEFYDDDRVKQADIYLDANGRLNLGTAVVNIQQNGDGGGGPSTTPTYHHQLLGLGSDDHPQYIHRTTARTITARHTFEPATPASPFVLGANAQGQVVVGLRADELSRSVLAGNGLTGGGLLTADRTITLGTPDTIDHDTANQLSPTSHTHELSATHNPGANERVLKTDGSGGLILQWMELEGPLDITNGGDLTVGNNILFVDASGSRVGINMAPDPQFQLDINGNIRWSGWGVGKMALQIEGATMICHYDGPGPYNTDFTGTVLGHKGQMPQIWDGIIFRPGKFGTKALQCATQGTNYIANPSFEVNLTGWATGGSDTFASSGRWTGGTTYTPPYGNYLLATTPKTTPTGSSYYYTDAIGAKPSTTYTASVYALRYTNTSGFTFRVYEYDSGSNAITHHDIAPSGTIKEWERLAITFTSDPNVDHLRILIYHNGTANTNSVLWDAVQLEESQYLTPYLDGSMEYTTPDGTTGGHAWAGTAHASASTRNYGYLQYDATDIIDTQEGSIAVWVQAPFNTGDAQSGSPSGIFIYGDSWNTESIYLAMNAGWDQVQLRSFAGSTLTGSLSKTVDWEQGSWHHICVAWNSSDIYLYVDGVESGPDAWTPPSPTSKDLIVGKIATAAQYLNSVLDDLLITDRQLPADEVRAIYESDAPIFAETSTFYWTIPNQTIWADEEGLWARDQEGNAIMGLSAVDGKMWGGIPLSAGDFVLGNGATAYLKWDLSLGDLELRMGDAGVEINNSDGITLISSSTNPINVIAGPLQLNFRNSGGSYIGNLRPGFNFGVERALSLNLAGGGSLTLTEDITNGDALSVEVTGLGTAGWFVIDGRMQINGQSGGIALEINTTSGALLVPRMTTTQRNSFVAQNGMIIYNTSTGTLQGRQGGIWTNL